MHSAYSSVQRESKLMNQQENCPCGKSASYLECCGRFIEQGIYPKEPELLMLSRYTAFAKHKKSYLIKTWHPKTCPPMTMEELKAVTWLSLNVFDSKAGLKKATVEFEASYQEGEEVKSFIEKSIFKKVKNRWVYFGEEANQAAE